MSRIENTDSNVADQATEAVHVIASTTGAVSHGAHATGFHLPGPLHKLEAVSHVVAAALSDHKTGNSVEDTVCGAISGGAEFLANAAVGFVVVETAAVVAPVSIASAVVGGSVAAQTIKSGVLGAALQDTISRVTKPVGEGVNQVCHATFSALRGDDAASSDEEVDRIIDDILATLPCIGLLAADDVNRQRAGKAPSAPSHADTAGFVEEIISLPQTHAHPSYITPDDSDIEETARSQIAISNAIDKLQKKHPNMLILQEGLAEDICYTDLSPQFIETVQNIFLVGIPKEFDSCNFQQRKLLYQKGAGPIKLALREIQGLHKVHDQYMEEHLAITLFNPIREYSVTLREIKKMPENTSAERKFKWMQYEYLRLKNPIANGSLNDLMFRQRELAAIQCAHEAAAQYSGPQKVVLIYGSAHKENFERHFIQSEIPYQTIDVPKIVTDTKILDENSRKFNSLVDRLEQTRGNYHDDLIDPFMRIAEGYDPSNLEHVRAAKNFLHFCHNNTFTTHVIVPDPLMPYPIKVCFELRNDEINRTVLEDSLGRVIPETFRYVDRSWVENNRTITAKYNTVITGSNQLAVFVQFLGVDHVNIGGRTETIGIIARFTDEMRLIANEANAEKLFIQFEPANKRLGSLLKKRYKYHEAETDHSNYEPFDFEGENYCTLEIDLKEPTKNFIETATSAEALHRSTVVPIQSGPKLLSTVASAQKSLPAQTSAAPEIPKPS